MEILLGVLVRVLGYFLPFALAAGALVIGAHLYRKYRNAKMSKAAGIDKKEKEGGEKKDDKRGEKIGEALKKWSGVLLTIGGLLLLVFVVAPLLFPKGWEWFEGSDIYGGVLAGIFLAAVLMASNYKAARRVGNVVLLLTVVALWMNVASAPNGDGGECELTETSHGELGECTMTIANEWSRLIVPFYGKGGSRTTFVKMDLRAPLLVAAHRPDGSRDICSFLEASAHVVGLGLFTGLQFAAPAEETSIHVKIERGRNGDHVTFPSAKCKRVSGGRRS